METIPEKIKENKKIKENEIKLETIPENSQLINENVEKIEIQKEIILPLVKEEEDEGEEIETIEIINDNIK